MSDIRFLRCYSKRTKPQIPFPGGHDCQSTLIHNKPPVLMVVGLQISPVNSHIDSRVSHCLPYPGYAMSRHSPSLPYRVRDDLPLHHLPRVVLRVVELDGVEAGAAQGGQAAEDVQARPPCKGVERAVTTYLYPRHTSIYMGDLPGRFL